MKLPGTAMAITICCLGLAACATVAPVPQDTADRIAASVRDKFHVPCANSHIRFLRTQTLEGLIWRINDIEADPTAKQALTDLYAVKCEGGKAYLVDIPRDRRIAPEAVEDRILIYR